MKIEPFETELVGRWIVRDGAAVGDQISERIDELIATHLSRVAVHENGWDELFKDPGDGRFWELTYPQGEMHGGGPPRLNCITRDEALVRYPELRLDRDPEAGPVGSR